MCVIRLRPALRESGQRQLILFTFVIALLPVLGNFIFNTVIFIISLSQSFLVALTSLAYLIVIHNHEYFMIALYRRSHSRAGVADCQALVMEADFGIPGLIAAPIYYAYMKEKLRARVHLNPA